MMQHTCTKGTQGSQGSPSMTFTTGSAMTARPTIIGMTINELVMMDLRMSLLSCCLSSWCDESAGSMTAEIDVLMLLIAR